MKLLDDTWRDFEAAFFDPGDHTRERIAFLGGMLALLRLQRDNARAEMSFADEVRILKALRDDLAEVANELAAVREKRESR